MTLRDINNVFPGISFGEIHCWFSRKWGDIFLVKSRKSNISVGGDGKIPLLIVENYFLRWNKPLRIWGLELSVSKESSHTCPSSYMIPLITINAQYLTVITLQYWDLDFFSVIQPKLESVLWFGLLLLEFFDFCRLYSLPGYT